MTALGDTTGGSNDDRLARQAVQSGLISPERVEEARRQALESGRSLAQVLIESGILTPDRAARMAEPRPEAPPPQAVGRFQIVRPIGRGGMGVVYEAFDPELQRRVAIKLMLPSHAAGKEQAEEDEQRFLREARLSAQLRHPNIVAVLDAGIHEGGRYLALELIEGESLAAGLERPRMSLRRKIEILRDVALALHAAHERGVIHRDVNPRNILLDADGHPYVTDFGLARAAIRDAPSTLTLEGTILGTPAYMSPEQAKGLSDVDRRADVYALGVVLYEMLTGRLPFLGESAVDTLAAILRDPPVPPSKHVPVPRVLESVCLQSLSKDPARRPPTSRDFAEALSGWLQREADPRAAARRRLLALLGVAAAVLVASVWMVKDPDPPPQGPPPTPSANPASGPVDLLALVDPLRDAVEGVWSRQDGSLVSDASRNCRILIPYRPPDEYDLSVAFTRRESNGDVDVIFSFGGQPLMWMMGGYENRVFGFEMIDGRHADANPTSQPRERCLENGRMYRARVEVRRAGVKAFLDGVPLSTWEGDPSQADVHDFWNAGGPLGLGSFKSPVQFHRVELQAVTGEGASLRPAPGSAPPPSFNAFKVNRASLRPGLIAEYHQGNTHDVLALRRIDPAVDFRWGMGAGWPGGPADRFCVRWSGYLAAPRTGLYVLQTRADDGVRLSIDRVTVLENWTKHAETVNEVVVQLHEGAHRLDLEYFEDSLDASMVLSWAQAGGSPPQVVPGDALFHAAADFVSFEDRSGEPLGQIRALVGHGQPVRAVVFSPDGRRLLSTSHDGTARLWDPSSGTTLHTLTGHRTTVVSGAFSVDSAFCLTGSWDNSLILWDTATGSLRRRFDRHAGDANAVGFLPDGLVAVSASSNKTVTLWNVKTGDLIRTLTGHTDRLYALAIHPREPLAVSGGLDKTLLIWDLSSGAKAGELEGHSARVQGAAFSPDGALVATASWDGTVRLWDTSSRGEKRVLRGHSTGAYAVAFDRDGALVAAGGEDATVRLWDVATGKQVKLLRGHSGAVNAVAFSPDGTKLASGGADGTVRIWRVD